MIVELVPATADVTTSLHSVSYTVSCPELCKMSWNFQEKFSCLLDGAPAAPLSEEVFTAIACT